MWQWRRRGFLGEARRRGVSAALIAEAEEKLQVLRGKRVARIDLMTISPIAKIPAKVKVLLQALLHRQLELAGAFGRELNEASFVPPFLIARAAQECALLAFFVALAVEESVKAGKTEELAKLDERLMKGMTGVKSKAWRPDPESLESLNVLTVIDRVEKTVPGVRQAYEDLCEFCHPNCPGTLVPFTRVDEKNYACDLVERPGADDVMAAEWALKGLVNGLAITEVALGIAEHYMTKLVQLCEKEIRDWGPWPPSIPYPRH